MRIRTSLTKNVINSFAAFSEIEAAAQEGTPAMAMFTGEAGLGKTTTGAYLFTSANGILVRCLKADTLSTFLERLANELGMDKASRQADMINYIVKELAIYQKPLFIDEADYLADKVKVLETIRDIYDLANVPIILIGYQYLPKKIKRLPQLMSRIARHVRFEPADFEDIKLLSDDLVENTEIADDLLISLLETSKGNIRRISIGLGVIEKYARLNQLKQIDLEQWAQQPFFPIAEF